MASGGTILTPQAQAIKENVDWRLENPKFTAAGRDQSFGVYEIDGVKYKARRARNGQIEIQPVPADDSGNPVREFISNAQKGDDVNWYPEQVFIRKLQAGDFQAQLSRKPGEPAAPPRRGEPSAPPQSTQGSVTFIDGLKIDGKEVTEADIDSMPPEKLVWLAEQAQLTYGVKGDLGGQAQQQELRSRLKELIGRPARLREQERQRVASILSGTY